MQSEEPGILQLLYGCFPFSAMGEVEPVSSSPSPSAHKSNTKDFKTLVSFYSSYVWNGLFGSSPSPDSNFLAKICTLYRKTLTLALRPRSRKRMPCLPLPLPSNPIQFSSDMAEPFTSRVCEVLEDIMAYLFTNLHIIQKNLHFWQSRAEDSDAHKIYFMLFERGPWAFLNGTYKLIHESVMDGSSSMRCLCNSASAHISERIVILTNLRFSLATFLAEVYVEVDRLGEELIKNSERSLPVLLTRINGLFLKLEESIGCLCSVKQNSSVDGICSSPLMFERLPEINQEGSQWTDCEIGDAINLIYQNLHKLDSYLSSSISKYKKPRRVTLYWVHYTCGAIGIAASSAWLVRHSSLMGSSDIDNWIREARDSTINFYNDHVEQPLVSIRDELFNTFRKRHKGVMELEEVQLTANSLHRMLLAFSEQAKGQKFPENASDQEMLGIVMARYEKELMHPIQNLLGGELARAMLIQVQKLKLDIETAMLELDQILRANEINFAVLAALPAFFLSFILFMLMRTWLKQDARAEGRGRIARLQRRLLLGEIEKWLMEYQVSVDQGLENDAQCMYGMMLYSLDRLCHAVERHAKGTGEWHWLRQDIVDLAKPGLQTAYKFKVTSRMERLYDCLLPSPKRQ